MRSLTKKMHKGQKGLTLIELLIVVAILGIIAAVIVPNLTTFIGSGALSAARTEAENVKTAALAYFADEGDWPATSADLMGARDYLNAAPIGTYTWTNGVISGADHTRDGTAMTWNATTETWDRA